MNLNKILVIGRMTRDPELVALASGTKVCNFGIATNESYMSRENKKVDRVEFHNIVVYGKSAENCAKYLRKGQLVMIEGKMATRSWDKEDGTKGYKAEIIATSVQFGPKAGQNGPEDEAEAVPIIDADSGDVRPASVKTTAKERVKAGGPDSIDYPEETIDPADIPF